MTKLELAEKTAKKIGVTQKKTIKIIDILLDVIRNAVANGENVEFRGFGRFRLSVTKKHTRFHPLSGEKLKLPARKHPKFRPSKIWVKEINQ